MKPEISFIIVNYNTKEITSNCISSLKKNRSLKSINYEIIVVDNNSSDDSLNYFDSITDKNVYIIKNKVNEGFGKANNIGVYASKGKYILMLNSDTLAHETNINELIRIMNDQTDIGVLSIKILNRDESIQSLGFEFPSLLNEIKLNMLFWNFKQMKRIRYKNYSNRGLFKVDWVSGCFILMRKEDFLKVNGFDEKIFMYAEDLDLCYKIKTLGKDICVYDKTEIFHLHGESSSKKDIKLSSLIKRRESYYYVIKKHKLISSISLNFVKFTYLINAILLFNFKKLKIKKTLEKKYE